ncbi:MAG TPA: hypothetical protein VK814_18165 [Acidobacteriaceae bacterium]|nr:hypothetical protein [Acidobacteriaceae bacterium]
MQIVSRDGSGPAAGRTSRQFRICYIDPIKLNATIRTLTFLGLAAGALGLAAGAPALAQQDPRIGSWTLTAAQASLDPANKLSITPVGDQMHVVMSGDRHFDFTAKANNHPSPAPGNPGFNEIQLHRIDKRQSEVKETKDGAIFATVHNKLSADGKELTITTVTPGHPDQITVWTRTGGAKAAHDPLAGEWTEDPSKTRLRQGLTLKIEPDGNGGVRFSGDYSYDARFDGKTYTLRNSRNDTVKLQLVDPHTVAAIYLRDDQVAQTDKWVVSPDGQELTVTSTGVLETGQHFNEKLTFKKP